MTETPKHQALKLFCGALAQWTLTTAFTRWAVASEPALMFVAVFLIQSLWWMNIQQTIRSGGVTAWLSWSFGAATGAVLGLLIS